MIVMMKKNMEYLQKHLKEDKLEDGIKKLESGMPVQYIVGHVDFYGNIIKVNKNSKFLLYPTFSGCIYNFILLSF